jgi:hypothetical protein
MAHANAGGHLQVPNVQALAQTWNGSGEQVPARYVRTEEAGAEVVVAAGAGCALPVVDLGRLLDPRSSEEELANLGSACQQGFFQVREQSKAISCRALGIRIVILVLESLTHSSSTMELRTR